MDKLYANTHVDTCFPDDTPANDILNELEYVVEQFFYNRFGSGINSLEDMMQNYHAKLRINLSVEIMEEFK